MTILIINNYDSFTRNLAALVADVSGTVPTIINNDAQITPEERHSYDAILLSPGPGHPGRPADFGLSSDVILDKSPNSPPVLGICLGHQGLAHLMGGIVGHAPEPVHGRTSAIHHDREGLFANIPSPFEAVRYHSLAVTDVPPELQVTAMTDDKVIMGLKHRERPLWGVQFHPESIKGEFGREIIFNFLSCAGLMNLSAPDQKALFLSVERIDNVEAPAQVIYETLFRGTHASFFLDSSERGSGRSRFSFMGDTSGPDSELIEYRTSDTHATVSSHAGSSDMEVSNIFSFLRDRINRFTLKNHLELPFEFNLGYVGYLGYELKSETVGKSAHKSDTPDAQFIFADRLLAIDHQDDTAYLLALDRPGASSWMETVRSQIGELAGHPDRRAGKTATLLDLERPGPISPSPRLSKNEYVNRVNRCLEYIRDGESYEICLTNAISIPMRSINVWSTYTSLRENSPVPYGALIELPGLSILSASPERFLKITANGDVESKPIKGTRPRSRDNVTDTKIAEALHESKKDRSENLMIVDLLRDDLNHVCETGTVTVPKLFSVETYPTVHQLVSTVTGRLRSGEDAISCVRAAFPGGSMTGAPKQRTMELIDDLEDGPRGVYSGSLGWFGLSGAADLSIVIRTIVITDECASFGVGGAVIALSDPEEEYEETVVKSRAMMTALGSHVVGDSR